LPKKLEGRKIYFTFPFFFIFENQSDFMKTKVRIAFTKNQLIILSIISLFALLGFVYFYFVPKPITVIDYFGNRLVFRQDLREANRIEVYPNEQALRELMDGSQIENITIAYRNTTDASYTTVESIEIAYKLRIGYLVQGYDFNISASEFNSLENITGERANPIIALISPSMANETSVRVKDSVVYISGRNLKEFDLATIKFLITSLNITVESE
jgi:hypothetical protein